MHNDLFFIPIISEALQESEPKAAMRDALARLRTLGSDPRYRTGYRQLLRFLGSVVRSFPTDAPHKAGAQTPEHMDRPLQIELTLERDGRLHTTWSFEQPQCAHAVSGLRPADYRLSTDTGRVLWQGTLAPRDLLWADAFPGRGLPLAAQTHAAMAQPTREIELMDGLLALQVYPGIEEGTLVITMRSPEVRP